MLTDNPFARITQPIVDQSEGPLNDPCLIHSADVSRENTAPTEWIGCTSMTLEAEAV